MTALIRACATSATGAHTMRVETIENIILTTMKQDIEDMLMAVAIAIGGIIVLWFCAMLG